MSQIHPAVADLLRYFEFDHLPPHLQDISRPFHNLVPDLRQAFGAISIRDRPVDSRVFRHL